MPCVLVILVEQTLISLHCTVAHQIWFEKGFVSDLIKDFGPIGVKRSIDLINTPISEYRLVISCRLITGLLFHLYIRPEVIIPISIPRPIRPA